MPQLSIDDNPPIGYPGQIAEPGAPTFIRSASAEGALVAGSVVKRGTNPEKQVEALEAGDAPDFDLIAGVVHLETSRPYDASSPIADGDPVGVVRQGVVYMEFSEAVTAGEMVGQTLASGLLTGIPEGTAAAAIATGIVVIPGLRIVQTTTAAGVARVEVNLFGAQPAGTVGSA